MEETLIHNSANDGINEATRDVHDDKENSITDEIAENFTVEDVLYEDAEYPTTEDTTLGEDAEPDSSSTEEVDMNFDLDELKAEFSELAGVDSIEDLRFPEKYRRFREMGLSPSEAYMATGEYRAKERHIPPSPLSVSRRAEGIPQRQLQMAREIFEGLTDMEIQALYKRVTK